MPATTQGEKKQSRTLAECFLYLKPQTDEEAEFSDSFCGFEPSSYLLLGSTWVLSLKPLAFKVKELNHKAQTLECSGCDSPSREYRRIS